jgi:hypothetical protein
VILPWQAASHYPFPLGNHLAQDLSFGLSPMTKSGSSSSVSNKLEQRRHPRWNSGLDHLAWKSRATSSDSASFWNSTPPSSSMLSSYPMLSWMTPTIGGMLATSSLCMKVVTPSLAGIKFPRHHWPMTPLWPWWMPSGVIGHHPMLEVLTSIAFKGMVDSIVKDLYTAGVSTNNKNNFGHCVLHSIQAPWHQVKLELIHDSWPDATGWLVKGFHTIAVQSKNRLYVSLGYPNSVLVLVFENSSTLCCLLYISPWR